MVFHAKIVTHFLNQPHFQNLRLKLPLRPDIKTLTSKFLPFSISPREKGKLTNHITLSSSL